MKKAFNMNMPNRSFKRILFVIAISLGCFKLSAQTLVQTNYAVPPASWYKTATNCTLDTLAGPVVTGLGSTSYDAVNNGQMFGTKGTGAAGMAADSSNGTARKAMNRGEYFQFRLKPSGSTYSLTVNSFSLIANYDAKSSYTAMAVLYSTDSVNWVSTDGKNIDSTPLISATIGTAAGAGNFTPGASAAPYPNDTLSVTFSTPLSINSGGYLYIRFIPLRIYPGVTTTSEVTITNLTVNGTVNTTASPSISVNPTSLTGFTYISGSGPSTVQTVSVSGSNLTGNITLTAPNDYEISNGGTSFSSSLNLTQSGGTVASTTISIRLKAGLSTGTYNSETVAVASSGATTVNISCSGAVTAALIVPTLGTLTLPSGLTTASAAFTLTAPTSNSSGAFTYTSSNTSVATISGATVTIVGAGTSTIKAYQAATSTYTADSTSAVLTVTAALTVPTLGTFTLPSGLTTSSAAFTITPPTSNSSGAFTYTSSNTSVATISGAIVTIVGAGTSTIKAYQAATSTYTADSTSAVLTVSAASTTSAQSLLKTNYTTNGQVSSWYTAATNCRVDTISGFINEGKGTSFTTGGTTWDSTYFGQSFSTNGGAYGVGSDGTTYTSATSTGTETTTYTAQNAMASGHYFEFRLKPTSSSYSLTIDSISITTEVAKSSIQDWNALVYSTDSIHWTTSDGLPFNYSPATLSTGTVGTGIQTGTAIGTPFTIAASIFSSPLNIPAGGTLWVRYIYMRKSSAITSLGYSPTITNVAILGTVNGASASPSISVNPTSLSGFTYVTGSGPSAAKTVSVSGSNLTGNITLTAPTDYEISNGGTTYSSSVSLTPTSGTVASTTISVRLKTGLASGNYNSENVTVASTGAASATIACSGSVTATLTVPTLGALTLPTGLTTSSSAFTLTAPSSNSSGAFTYTSSNTSVATISGTTVTIVGAGTSTIKAYQAATSTYAADSTSAVLTVSAATVPPPTGSVLLQTNYSLPPATWYTTAANCVLDTLAGPVVTGLGSTSYDAINNGQMFGTKGTGAAGMAADSSNGTARKAMIRGEYFQFRLRPASSAYALSVNSFNLIANYDAKSSYTAMAVLYSTDTVNWVSTDGRNIDSTPLISATLGTAAGAGNFTPGASAAPYPNDTLSVTFNTPLTIKSGSYLYIRFIPLRIYPGVTTTSEVTITNVTVIGSVNPTVVHTTYKSNGNVNISSAANWLCNCTGSTYTAATIPPADTTNIIVQNNHLLTVDKSFTVGSSVAMTLMPLSTIVTNSGDTLTTNSNLLLESDSTGTASIGISQGVINGNVTVERYIPAHTAKAYTLVSAPVNSPTIYSAWQENGQTTAGFGTTISGAASGNGFDFASTNGVASIYKFADTTSPRWIGLTNTNTNQLSAGTGFLLFVRGDRTVGTTSTSSSATTLRASGSIVSGNIVFATTGGTNGTPALTDGANFFNLIANPFACAIDWTNAGIIKTNINAAFNVYDPNLNVFVSSNGTTVSPSTSKQQAKYIQQGQAFFISNTAASPKLTIPEAAKITNINTASGATVFGIEPTAQLNINMYKTDNSQPVFADGTVAIFNENYSSAIGNEDAPKFTNFNENLSLSRNNASLSIEGRPVISTTDTLFLQMNNLSANNYQFVIDGNGFGNNLKATLVDQLYQTRQDLNVNGINQIDFSVPSVGSLTGSRFIIVFSVKTAASLLPDPNAGFEIQISPNPVRDMLKINYQVDKNESSNICLINGAGQVLKNIPLGQTASGTINISMSEYANGVYYVELINGGKRSIKKAVKL